MKRPLSLILAGALALGTMGATVAPAAAQSFGLTIGTGNWDNDSWHDNGHRRGHYRHHRRHVEPGFSFSFGVPSESYSYYQPRRHHRHHRDCWWNEFGERVCRY